MTKTYTLAVFTYLADLKWCREVVNCQNSFATVFSNMVVLVEKVQCRENRCAGNGGRGCNTG